MQKREGNVTPSTEAEIGLTQLQTMELHSHGLTWSYTNHGLTQLQMPGATTSWKGQGTGSYL